MLPPTRCEFEFNKWSILTYCTLKEDSPSVSLISHGCSFHTWGARSVLPKDLRVHSGSQDVRWSAIYSGANPPQALKWWRGGTLAAITLLSVWMYFSDSIGRTWTFSLRPFGDYFSFSWRPFHSVWCSIRKIVQKTWYIFPVVFTCFPLDFPVYQTNWLVCFLYVYPFTVLSAFDVISPANSPVDFVFWWVMNHICMLHDCSLVCFVFILSKTKRKIIYCHGKEPGH